MSSPQDAPYPPAEHVMSSPDAPEGVRIASFTWETGTGALTWTAPLEALYGLPSGTGDPRYEDWVARIHPADRARVTADLRRVLEHEAELETEFRVVWPDGSVHDLLAQGRVAGGTDGVSRHLAGVTVDITAHHTVEAELRQRIRQAELAADVGVALTSADPLPRQLQRCAEALVRHLDAAFARVWELDRDTLVLRASAGLYTHLDGPHGRVPVGMFKIGQIAAERRPHLTNTVVGDPRVSDQEWARREGMVAFAGYPLLVDDRLVGVMALFARHELAETTLSNLSTVADAVALGIARAEADESRAILLHREQAARDELETINRVGQILSAELDLHKLVQAVTDAATTLSGAQFGAFFYNMRNEQDETYTLYTLSGAPREAFAHYPNPRMTAIFGPTFRGEGILRLADVRADPRFGLNDPYFGLPAGHLPVVSYLAVPVLSRSSEVIGGLFFGHSDPDVFSERAERIVTGLAAQAAIAMDNARLYGDAQVALRVRDEFLSAVAHDLKTPLAAVKGRVQLLQRRAARSGALDLERLAIELGNIDLATTKIARLIDHLLDMAHAQAGRTPELERHPTDIVALTQKVVAEHQRGAERHRIDVQTDLPQLNGSWDAARLERVFDNLLSNAIKYTPEGGVIAVTITHLRDSAGEWAVVSVRDAGVGIAPDDLPHVFERFYRAASVVTYASGSGIGLASARQIVELHAGTITAASELGVGSTFTVRLPLCETSPVPPTAS